jgi:hypothetical protein
MIYKYLDNIKYPAAVSFKEIFSLLTLGNCHKICATTVIGFITKQT